MRSPSLIFLGTVGLVFFLIFGGYFAYRSLQNHSGICVREGRYLSDVEIMAIAFSDKRHLLGYQRRVADGEIDAIPELDEPAEFLSKYAGCCSVVSESGTQVQLGFNARVRGLYRGYVRYELSVPGKTGGEVKFGPAYLPVTNCGEVWNGIP